MATRSVNANADRIRQIRTFPSLVKYLRDELSWPIEADDFEDLTYDWEPEELGIDAASAAKIDEVKQLRPLADDQPWGIFFVKFEPKQLPVVALRRLLNSMVIRKRASANKSERQAWAMNDLMFISSYGESGEGRHISFAHFSQPEGKNDLPTLKVLGWDNLDTPLHLDLVAAKLTECLSWPDDEKDIDGWRDTWKDAFSLRHREIITTARDLAIRLAALARAIRDRISTALSIENDRGPLTKLMQAFQSALMHDLDAEGFADMYAQTIAYGLLSARISDPKSRSADDLTAHMKTNPFLKELLQTFLRVGGRKGKAGGTGIDFDELGVSEVVELLDDANMEVVIRDFGDQNPQEDPVIHFYELFLKEYDAEKRIDRGVFYTPRPVVSYIVQSVDELLCKKFGLEDGLADTTSWGEMARLNKGLKIPLGVSPEADFVQILDPAVGTGTFLVEVVDLIYRRLVSKWKAKGHGDKKINVLWNEYVPKHLLTRMYGYEIMMAPYAIAHLKIGIKLYETGYLFGNEERAHVYLTDSLEPPHDSSGKLEFAVPALAHEAKAVSEVKLKHCFTVIVGNPPYLREKKRGPERRSQRIGGWIRFGDSKSRPLFDDFIDPLTQFGLGVHAKLAYEMSVMFWRLALWLATERHRAPSIVGMISPRAYLTSPGHVGMRLWMQNQGSELFVTDLGGDNRGARKSENIFDIETGVCISLWALLPRGEKENFSIHYREIVGDAESKLNALIGNSMFDLKDWRTCQAGAGTFIPTGTTAFADWPLLTDIFPWQHSGSQFKRLWPISESKDVLSERWRQLMSLKRSERAAAYVETRDRQIAGPAGGRASKKFTAIGDLGSDAKSPKVVRYCYRALDRQWCFADERLADFIRPSLVRSVSSNQVFAATLMSKVLGQGPAVTVTACLPDMDIFCNRGAKDVIPLWRDSTCREANITRGLLKILNETIGIEINLQGMFCYVMAVLGSPNFFERFETELGTPGIRIPISKRAETIQVGISLGAKFVWLQTFGERWLGHGRPPQAKLGGRARVSIPIPTDPQRYPNDYSYDSTSKTLLVGEGEISDVAPAVFGYCQSGFKPVESWLRYRMAVRGGRAGRAGSRSSLDQIRPERWCFTDELMELIWVVEGCVELWPQMSKFLEMATSGDLFSADDLPLPTSEEKSEPVIPDENQGSLL